MTKKRQRHTSIGLNLEIPGVIDIAKADVAVIISNKLTGSQIRLWIYLKVVDSLFDEVEDAREVYQNLPTVAEIAERIGASVDTVEKDLRKLKTLELLPKWFAFRKSKYADTERRIRDRLQGELGGQVEVVTAVGRIDLLTESEVIEIKDISDWKEALGKILAYSAFFPEHSKRIHLFGRTDLAKLALASATCEEFNVVVTFEEVKP